MNRKPRNKFENPTEKDFARWLASNRKEVALKAKQIIREHGLTQEKVFTEWTVKNSVYPFFLEYVKDAVQRLPPIQLGQYVSAAEGRTVDLLGMDRTSAPPTKKVTVHMVNRTSNAWLGQDWGGLSILRRLAASVLIAEICNQLEIDVEYLHMLRPPERNVRVN
jgi:hypothetical protein